MEEDFIEIDCGTVGIKRFGTKDELKQWVQSEDRAWSWMQQLSNQLGEGLINSRHEIWGQIRNTAEEWGNPHKPHRVAEIIQSLIKRGIQPEDPQFILSDSPEGKFVAEVLAQQGRGEALGAYSLLIGKAVVVQRFLFPDIIEGIINAVQFQQGIKWTDTGYRQVLEGLCQSYNKQLEQGRNTVGHLNDQLHDNASLFSGTLKTAEAELSSQRTTQTAELDKLKTDYVQQLNAIKETYDEKLALQKPVEYWDKKEQKHGKRAFWFGLIAAGLGIVAIIVLGSMSHWIFGQLDPNMNPKHWQIGLFGISAFISVWFIRVFVRLFFSHQHLATDAAERSMMILTYLAMMRDGEHFQNEDRKLIVQHIFRSASDGIVKDDAAPPTVWSWGSKP